MKTANRVTLALFMLSAALLAGCSTPVHVEYNSASYAQWHNFAWKAPGPKAVSNPVLDSGILTTRVQKAVVRVLRERGYAEVADPRQADFLVTYHTATALQQQPQPAISFAYGTYGPGFNTLYLTQPGPYQIQVGSLILDVIDAKTHKLVWRGWITRGLDERDYTQQAVDHAVQRLFKRFPPPESGG